MDESRLTESLAEAGLKYRGVIDPATPLIPPNLAGFANSCPAEEVADVEYLMSEDPQLLEKANSGWYRLAREGGLFAARDPEFLLAVDCAEPDEPRLWRWARVSLSDQWDIAGAGAATGILGNGSGHPAFVMLSLDGESIVRAQQGETSTEFVLVREPHHVQFFRNLAAQMLRWPDTTEPSKAAIERWLTAAAE
ncbi:hypothetical protein [Streptomyces noursei]|uniref:hypothetical protein n=1 Tax=Streptomyces noursei TaxID=1971 RepID=UPI000C9BBEF4|nr:hypothetical protein [Streptomyces noursei]